jgi:hypothetical protein
MIFNAGIVIYAPFLKKIFYGTFGRLDTLSRSS